MRGKSSTLRPEQCQSAGHQGLQAVYTLTQLSKNMQWQGPAWGLDQPQDVVRRSGSRWTGWAMAESEKTRTHSDDISRKAWVELTAF